jgi:transcriptional regulator with XRE-family HTH domain
MTTTRTDTDTRGLGLSVLHQVVEHLDARNHTITAERLDVSRSLLGQWLRGHTRITLDRATQLAHSVGLSVVAMPATLDAPAEARVLPSAALAARLAVDDGAAERLALTVARLQGALRAARGIS